MDKLVRASILINLIQELRKKENSSWCGETHLQKIAYFLKAFLNVPLEYNFILYKHGPFSFDLRADLTKFRGYGLMEYEIEDPNYGPRLKCTEFAEKFQEKYPNAISSDYKEKIEFIARIMGKKGVVELEKLGTALYFSLMPESENTSDKELAKMINNEKNHVSVEDAIKALKELNKIKEKATKKGLIN